MKLYRATALSDIILIGEMHRFIPALAAFEGANIVEIPVNHRVRHHGESKYGLGRVIRVLLDAILLIFLRRYLTRPIHFFGGIGLAFISLSFLFLGSALFLKYSNGTSMISTPLPTLSGLLFLIGVLAILLSLSTEIAVRAFLQSGSRATNYREVV